MVPPKMIIKLLDYVPFLPSKLVAAFKEIAGPDRVARILARRRPIARPPTKDVTPPDDGPSDDPA